MRQHRLCQKRKCYWNVAKSTTDQGIGCFSSTNPTTFQTSVLSLHNHTKSNKTSILKLLVNKCSRNWISKPNPHFWYLKQLELHLPPLTSYKLNKQLINADDCFYQLLSFLTAFTNLDSFFQLWQFYQLWRLLLAVGWSEFILYKSTADTEAFTCFEILTKSQHQLVMGWVTRQWSDLGPIKTISVNYSQRFWEGRLHW